MNETIHCPKCDSENTMVSRKRGVSVCEDCGHESAIHPSSFSLPPLAAPLRLLLDHGAPGVGKSTFAAQLTHTRGDTVIAAQFCEWDKPDRRNAPRVVRSLAFQVATRLPDYRKLLLPLQEIAELDRKDAAELFDYLLANPLRSVIHGGRERYLIVIDALNEADDHPLSSGLRWGECERDQKANPYQLLPRPSRENIRPRFHPPSKATPARHLE